MNSVNDSISPPSSEEMNDVPENPENVGDIMNDITREIIDNSLTDNSDNVVNDSNQNGDTNTSSEMKEKQEEKEHLHSQPKCPKCKSSSSLLQFKKSSFKPKNKLQVCWIYRAKCSDLKCGTWFGPLKRYDRNAFIEVDDLGRPLGRFQRSEMSSKMSMSESNEIDESQKDEEKEKEEEEEKKEEKDNEEEEEEEEEEEPETLTKDKEKPTRKKRKPYGKLRLSNPKQATQNRKKLEAKKETPKKDKRKGYVYVTEPVEPENEEKEPRESRVRKCRTEQSTSKTEKVEPATKKRKYNTKKVETVRIVAQTPQKSILEKKKVETQESTAQTDTDELMKSYFFENIFDNTIKEEFDEATTARLLDQSMFLKKKFVMLARTNKELKKQIDLLRDAVQKYQTVTPIISQRLQDIRLTYSDHLRRLRDDVLEQKEEFRQHHSEVLSIMRKNQNKYLNAEKELNQKAEDMKLKMQHLEAVIALKEKEIEYERDRAEYYLRQRDSFEQRKNEARLFAKDVEAKLNDTLFIKDNEKCAHCQIGEKLRRKMTAEVAHMTLMMDNAMKEKTEYEVRTQKAERCAQILGNDVDRLSYENRTWKAQIEKLKEQIKDAKSSNTPRMTPKNSDTPSSTPSSSNRQSGMTPKSVMCNSSTPSSAEMERVSPEDGEIVDTPPPQPTKENNEKTKKPPPIAENFASWVPKERLNAPAPEIPKSLTPFGVPIRKEEKKPTMGPTSLPLPWDRTHIANTSTSSALAEVAARVDAEAFLGTGPPVSTYSAKVAETAAENKKIAQKRGIDEEASVKKKKSKEEPVWIQKMKANGAKNHHEVGGSTNISNMKKIPKKSDQPPPPELAKALGVRLEGEAEEKGIPGLSLIKLDTKEVEAPSPKKINPPAVVVVGANSSTPSGVAKKPTIITPPKNNQKKKKNKQKQPFFGGPNTTVSPFGVKTGGGGGGGPPPGYVPSWARDMPSQRRDNYFGQHNEDRSFASSSSLPWHREPRNSNNNPFGVGEQPRDDPWGRRPPNQQPPPHQRHQHQQQQQHDGWSNAPTGSFFGNPPAAAGGPGGTNWTSHQEPPPPGVRQWGRPFWE